MNRNQYIGLGVGVTGAILLFTPVWREMHHEGLKGQSSFRFLMQNLAKHERATHISVDEAVLNSKARYMLGVLR